MNSSFFPRRPGLAALAVLAAALMLTACAAGAPEGESSSSASEVTSVKVGVIPVAECAPVFIAQDGGFFEEEGLAVEFQVVQNAASIAPSVLNGQLQFGTAAVSPFLSAVSKGLPLTAVANGSSVSASAEEDPSAILVLPDRGITSPQDLADKTVAVNALGSVSHVTAAANIDADGGDYTRTTFVAMPFPDMGAALQRGAIDAAAVVEPFQAQGVEGGAVVLSHPNSETLTSGTFTLLFTSEAFAASDPATVEKFQRAMSKASRAAAGDPALVREVLQKHLNLDAAIAETVRLPAYDDELSTDALQRMADLMLALGLMEAEIHASDAVWNSKK